MVTLTSPKSPRSVAQAASSDALNPASPSRDINAIVEDAAKRFDVMDQDLKSLMQDMKDYQASMVHMNENRLKTAKHMETFVMNSPFANFIDPPNLKAVIGTEAPASSSGSVGSSAAPGAEEGDDTDAKEQKDDEEKAEPEKKIEENIEEKKPDEIAEVEDAKEQESTPVDSVGERKAQTIAKESKVDTESFAGVHESAYRLSKKYDAQYGDYLLRYVENWERVVSTRISGLLIHYRELQENTAHYHKKVGGLLSKVDKSKNVKQKLADKLDRNEIKEMGAVEARDTVGEHLYLYINEVMERAWRDVFPLLLRFCRFEADSSAAQANVLAGLVTVSENIQAVGEDEGCDIMGRLESLQKKHPEEVCTVENPFFKLTPIKKKKKEPSDGASVSDESHDLEQTSSNASPENVEV